MIHDSSNVNFLPLGSSFNIKRDEKQLEPKQGFMDDVTVERRESTNHFGEQLLDIDV